MTTLGFDTLTDLNGDSYSLQAKLCKASFFADPVSVRTDASYGISSLTIQATGNFLVTTSVTFANSPHTVTATHGDSSHANQARAQNLGRHTDSAISTTTVELWARAHNGTTNVTDDCDSIDIQFWEDLA